MPRIRKSMNVEEEEYEIMQMQTGFSKLYLAAWQEDFHTVRMIIQSGADINCPESSNIATPIFGAVLSKNKQMMQEFIAAGAEVNAESSELGATPLYIGISTKKVEIVQLLLDSGADIHKRVFKDNTVLHFCAELGTAKISKLLIERGVGVDVRNKDDETPLHIAAKAGKLQIVRLLIAKGADVSATCVEPINEHGVVNLWSNVTSLLLAAHRGHTDIVDFLIKKGADVNVKTSANCTALHLAAQCEHIEIVNMLLKAGAKSSVNLRSNHDIGHTPLVLATKSGNMDVIKALLKVEGIEVNPVAAPATPLVVAAGRGRLDVVELLLKNGALVSGCTITKMTPLHSALMVNRDDTAEFLIKHGADIHAEDYSNATPLHVACDKTVSMNIIRMLVEKGADANMRKDDGTTPLHLAAQHDHVEIVKFLVDCGADPMAMKKDKWTALHYAAMNGNGTTAAYIMTKVSDVDVVSSTLTTPLHLAVEEGHREVVKLLLKNGANVSAQNNIKCTPLHFALKNGHSDIAEWLLKHNALVNVKEKKEGCTPLFLAVKNELERLVSLLLDKSADVNLANKFGILPIHVAAKAENVEIVKALLAKGAYYNKEAQTDDYSGVPLDFAQETENARLISIFELIEKLFNAVVKNNADQVERCIQAGTIVNGRKANGKTALHYAISNHNDAAVKALLTGGADITLTANKIDSPLQIAVANGNMGTAEILLAHARNLSPVKYNFVVNKIATNDGGTVLHTAVGNNRLDIVKILLKNGTIYNIKNDSGKTPLELTIVDEAIKSLLISVEKLFEAVKKEDGLEEVTRILENDNSIVNSREADNGATPLYQSVSKGHTNTASVLLSNGADYCLVTNDGSTPLHITASEGRVTVVKVLLNFVRKNDAEKVYNFINATTVSGTAALHVASNLEVVKCLLQAGAIYNIRDSEDKTALELTQNEDVRKLFKTTHQLFEDVEKGVCAVTDTLNGLELEEFRAVTGTRNMQGETLVQVALTNGRMKVATQLIERLKKLG